MAMDTPPVHWIWELVPLNESERHWVDERSG